MKEPYHDNQEIYPNQKIGGHKQMLSFCTLLQENKWVDRFFIFITIRYLYVT